MCKIMNSQEANAKYEEIRDNIYMLTDYKNQYGLEDILAFKAGYNISDSEVSTVGTSGNNSVMDNAGYYKNMKTMHNDNTWRKINRFGAICIFITGLLTIITTVFTSGMTGTIFMLIYLLLATIVTVVYSKKIYDKEIEK